MLAPLSERKACDAEQPIVCLGPEPRKGVEVCGSESPLCSGAVETRGVRSQNLEKGGFTAH